MTSIVKRIVLASSSPRRKQLLHQLLGKSFDVITSSYDEVNEARAKPAELAVANALGKGRDVAQNEDSGVIISADTFIFFENEVLGKPVTEERAKEMLRKLSGNIIEVFTGLVVIDVETGQELQDYEVTKLFIKELTEQEIDSYVSSGEPLDKAGAFGIQERGAFLVKKIEGCYFNVVGLPLFKLNLLLKKVGVSMFDDAFVAGA